MGKLKDLFTNRIWSIDTDRVAKVSKGYARLVSLVKLIRITINTFNENRMGFQCVALSYFVTLSLIPLLAFTFAVTGGLGLSGYLDTILLAISSDVDSDLLMLIREKAGNIIDIAKSGGVGVISALMFLWAILWMMFQVERVFNNVWGIRHIPRKLYTRFGFYFLVLLLTPLLVVLFGSGFVYYTNFYKLVGLDLSELRFLPKLFGYIGFWILSTLILSIMYKFIPAAKVKYKYALNAAALDAIVFAVFQFLYLETQVFVARMNMVYGVLAAIPLFLIWLNFSWQIIIYGAELSYSFQHVKNYGLEEAANI